MKLVSQSFQDGQPIPGEFAFAVTDAVNRISLSANRNPHLAWSDVPEGTQSFVVVCHDPDVPSRGDDVNQPGRVVPASLPRVDFFHWLLLDIPASRTEIAAGSHSDGVTPRGKPGLDASAGLRHGINDYTGWFAGDEQMKGDYHGYDGPCPPWNDTLVHHYVFTIYALANPTLEINGPLTGANVRAAIADAHVLGEASLTGLYSLNPDVVIDAMA
ncbi:YbhB/YbcL family Raf kinase inhibitor-like protein [Paraburkholderia xenovorans]|uniref:YbhB/YbcL family Raf kinase inhibitor-like protein n=1 Tax=Paraburkholderia xenovorans TaxID=36873 RepID=UPI0038B98F72